MLLEPDVCFGASGSDEVVDWLDRLQQVLRCCVKRSRSVKGHQSANLDFDVAVAVGDA